MHRLVLLTGVRGSTGAGRTCKSQQAQAGRIPGWHIHHLKPRHVWNRCLFCHHQSATGSFSAAHRDKQLKRNCAISSNYYYYYCMHGTDQHLDKNQLRTLRIQAGILAVGGTQSVITLEDGRPVSRASMRMTLSADQRVYDGKTTAQFLQAVVSNLSNPVKLLV